MVLATLGLLAQMAVVPPAEPRADEHVARDARAAQQRFERVRRANLPRRPAGRSTSDCDAHIGRFCYWYDSTETVAEREPEPLRIVLARLELLALLDSVAGLSPADPWIVGQRVRYYIEAGKLDDARRVAHTCGAEEWWCSSLAGLVHHVSQEYVTADSAFVVALRAMPDDQRCEWLDLSVIADARWRRTFRDASCPERKRLAAAVLSLGRPLWMVEGNDLRTEHFARHTMALIHERSANAHGMSFGDDSRELLLRYGWPEWFTRHELGVPSALPSFAVTGHEREPAYYFLPEVQDPERARPGEASWRLRAQSAPTRYAPRHIERLTSLPHQLGRFARGNSLLIVAAFRIDDSILERDKSEAALAVSLRDTVRVISRARDRAVSGMVAADTMIVSLEILGDSTRHASRARYTIVPLQCSVWCLSDILVIDPTKVGRSAGPVEAARAAYPELRVSAGAPVGVFFEVTRTESAPTVARPAAFTLTVTPVRVHLARRVAASLRLASRPDAVRMRWQGVIGAAGARDNRAIALNIPNSARGHYRIQLTVTPEDGSAITASRELEIVR